MIELVIYGEPKAQARHRHRTVQPKDENKKAFVMTYDPDKKYKEDLLTKIQHFAPPEPFECALRVDLVFHLSRPMNHFGTGRNAGVLKGSAPKHHLTKPDIDNLQKFLYDSLSGVFWRDDRVIVKGTTSKVYGPRPMTIITISEL